MAFIPQRPAISTLYCTNSLSRDQYGGRASGSLVRPREQDCSFGVYSGTKSPWGNHYHISLSTLIGVFYEKNLLNRLNTYSYNVKLREISGRLSPPRFISLGIGRVKINVEPGKIGAICIVAQKNYAFPFSSVGISGWPKTESSLTTELLGGNIFRPRL